METTAFEPWGVHLVLDISNCDKDKIKDPEYIREFSKALVKKIDMIPYGEPQVVHFCDHVADKAGWTLIQLIETSNIMGHFCDNTGDAYVDVFSCKKFDREDVFALFDEWFGPKCIHWTQFNRNCGKWQTDMTQGFVPYK